MPKNVRILVPKIPSPSASRDPVVDRMLYETAERFNLKNSKAFVNISYSKPPYQHPVRSFVAVNMDMGSLDWDMMGHRSQCKVYNKMTG